MEEKNSKELSISAVISRKYRGAAYKKKYIAEKASNNSNEEDDILDNNNDNKIIDSKSCEQCTAMVPTKPGCKGIYGSYRRCNRNAIFSGAGKCFTHKAGLYLSSVLERGLYKESIILGPDGSTIAEKICNPDHYVQVLWNYKGNNGYGLYVKSGQEGDMISFMDGEYKSLQQCQPNYKFKTAFLIPVGYEKPISLYIDALQTPIVGRGVMSFANYSNTPNCKRVDNFDKMNCRVWYQLTQFLKPNKDGSLHELTIAYGSGCSPTTSTVLPLENRIIQDPTKGFWPGYKLKKLIASINDNEDGAEQSRNDHSQEETIFTDYPDEMDLQIGNPVADNSIETQQKLCILTYKERARSLTSELNSFKKDCLESCKQLGFTELYNSFKRPIFNLKKRLRDGLDDHVNEMFHPDDD